MPSTTSAAFREPSTAAVTVSTSIFLSLLVFSVILDGHYQPLLRNLLTSGTEPGMDASIAAMEDLVRLAWHMRDVYIPIVVFHREELVLVGNKIQEIKIKAGDLDADVPVEVLNVLAGWKHWDDVFATGM